MAKDRDQGDQYKYMLRLPPKIGDALREQAKAEERTISRVVQRAILTYLTSSGRVMDHGAS